MESRRNKRLADLEKSRELTYGPFSKNLKKISKVWSVILDQELTTGVPVNPGIPAYKIALMYAAARSLSWIGMGSSSCTGTAKRKVYVTLSLRT